MRAISASDMALKWKAGSAYGPVLSQADLYLLGSPLQLHPLLAGSDPGAKLVVDITKGSAAIYAGGNLDAPPNTTFEQRVEPATIPRIKQLWVICDVSPWCTVVRNENGVTLEDVVVSIYRDYSGNYVTNKEFSTLPARIQDVIRRRANDFSPRQPNLDDTHYANTSTRYRRTEWFRDQCYIDHFHKDKAYEESRLAFSAPNVFIMKMSI